MTGLSARSSDSQEEDSIQEEFININEPEIIPYHQLIILLDYYCYVG